MGMTIEDGSTEQQELLDSGLRILARMIAAAHIRRTASRRTIEDTVVPGKSEHPERFRESPEQYSGDT